MHQQRSMLHIAAAVLIAVSTSCQLYRTDKPLMSESVIASPDIYESQDDKLLVLKHQSGLQHIYDTIRDQFSPDKLEFFLISGICFRKLQLKSSYDTYLSINTRSSASFSADESSFEKRASQIFTTYSKPLLSIAAAERAVVEDDAVAGIMVSTRWNVEKEIQPDYGFTTYEEINLVVQKQQINGLLAAALSDQQLLDQSTVIALSEGEIPRIIQLTLE